MKILSIANLKLTEMRRELGDLLVPFIFPVVFLGAFKLAFSSAEGPMGVPFFDYLTPGMLVFALLMLAVTVATSLAREVDKETLARLRLSLMSSADLLLGAFLAWTLVACVQVVILFGMSALLGFAWEGGLVNFLWAMVVCCLAAEASIALGLLVASFAKSEGNAGALTTLVTVPVAFFVGSFMPMPLEGLHLVVPWAQAIRSLRALLLAGVPIDGLLPGLLLMVAQIVVLMAIGILVYSRARLRPERLTRFLDPPQL